MQASTTVTPALKTVGSYLARSPIREGPTKDAEATQFQDKAAVVSCYLRCRVSAVRRKDMATWPIPTGLSRNTSTQAE